MRLNFYSGLILATLAAGGAYAFNLSQADVEQETSLELQLMPEETLAAQTEIQFFKKNLFNSVAKLAKPAVKIAKPMIKKPNLGMKQKTGKKKPLLGGVKKLLKNKKNQNSMKKAFSKIKAKVQGKKLAKAAKGKDVSQLKKEQAK